MKSLAYNTILVIILIVVGGCISLKSQIIPGTTCNPCPADGTLKSMTGSSSTCQTAANPDGCGWRIERWQTGGAYTQSGGPYDGCKYDITYNTPTYVCPAAPTCGQVLWSTANCTCNCGIGSITTGGCVCVAAGSPIACCPGPLPFPGGYNSYTCTSCCNGTTGEYPWRAEINGFYDRISKTGCGVTSVTERVYYCAGTIVINYQYNHTSCGGGGGACGSYSSQGGFTLST